MPPNQGLNRQEYEIASSSPPRSPHSLLPSHAYGGDIQASGSPVAAQIIPYTLSPDLALPAKPASASASASASDDEATDQLQPDSATQKVKFTESPFFKAVIAGAGFTCDAYDLFVMNMVIVLLEFQYSNYSDADKSLIADAVLAGSVVGQLLFGVLADYIGRKKGFIATLSLLIIGATASALSFETAHVTIFQCMALWRFVLGVGIGGEYPLAATVSSEASEVTEGRGRRVAGVFSMQGVGSLLAPVVILSLLGIFGHGNVNWVWRTALMLGALPGLAMIYFRIRMKESEAFTQTQTQRADGESSSQALQLATRSKMRALRRHWKTLLGTAGNWFIFDVVFYANGLFSSSIVSKWYEKPDHAHHELVHDYLINVGLATMYLSMCALPGYWASMMVIDKIGRRKLQLIGYTGMIVTYTMCGLLSHQLEDIKGVFFLLYGLTFFFCNFGPNVTTFVIPSEAFPTSIRATAHGISAAVGKLGAVVGGAMMPAILNAHSFATVMYVCSVISAVGWVWTWVLTKETMHHSTHDHNEAELEKDMLALDQPIADM